MNASTKEQRTYWIATIVAIAVLLVNQAFIQYWLYQKAEDAKVINLAGRQRMLSQRVHLLILQKQQGLPVDKELRERIQQWVHVHAAFLGQSSPVEVKPLKDPAVVGLLQGLTPYIEQVQAWADEKAFDRLSREELSQTMEPFLQKMEQVVGRLEALSQSKLRFIQTIEVVLMIISISIIFAELKVIYLPVQRSLSQLVKQKDALLQEFNHRVRNNITLLTSLLHLHMEGSRDERASDVVRATSERLQALGQLHGHLLHNQDTEGVDIARYLDTLVKTAISAYADKQSVITELEVQPIRLQSKSCFYLGLLVNEIITNSLKHGVIPGRTLKLRLVLKVVDDQIELSVSDNGEGLPLETSNSFGSDLIGMMTQQLKGRIDLQNEHGLQYHLSFPSEELVAPTAP